MLRRIVKRANQNEGAISLAGAVIALCGLILQALTYLLPSSFAPVVVSFVQQNRETVVWVGLLVIGLGLTLASVDHGKRLRQIEDKIQVLESRPEILLDETTSANLSSWSFGSAPWTSDHDGLSVTNSPLGGTCKDGASWESYEFAFEFKIMYQCAGWVVRARSKGECVMVQCTNTQLRPHIFIPKQTSDGGIVPGYKVIKQIDHNQTLNEWNKARTEVKGQSIKVWINDKLVWSDSELLKDFVMGTVGFRCSHDEHALFRNIKVVKG